MLLIAGCPAETGAPAANSDDASGPPNVLGITTTLPSVPNQLVVIATPGASQADVDELIEQSGGSVVDRLDELSAILVSVPASQRDGIADELSDSEWVEGVGANLLLPVALPPNDEFLAVQWHLDAIDASRAWARTNGDSRVIIAIVDTGVDVDHPDLAAKLVGGANTYDGVSGWDDKFGHGTAVAGVAGAISGNQIGVAGVAAGCTLLPICATDGGETATSWSLAAAIALAVAEGAKVVNVSFQEAYTDPLLMRQAELASLEGALVVFCAGNSGSYVSEPGSDYALFVGATDRDDQIAGFSAYGEFVDLVAPGKDIATTTKGGQYGTYWGTSFAAPIVSGAAALVWSVNPTLRPSTVRGVLLATADDLGGPGEDEHFGAGRVNVGAAVELASGLRETNDGTPPTVAISPLSAEQLGRQRLTVSVQASDTGGVSEVVLLIDGTRVAGDVLAPYSFTLNTASYPPGPHTLTALATDIYGNRAQAQSVVTLGGVADSVPPTVKLSAPADGASIRGLVTVLADAADSIGLSAAEVRIDGALLTTLALQGTRATVAYNWNSASVETGVHKLEVSVVDAAGNRASASSSVSVTR